MLRGSILKHSIENLRRKGVLIEVLQDLKIIFFRHIIRVQKRVIWVDHRFDRHDGWGVSDRRLKLVEKNVHLIDFCSEYFLLKNGRRRILINKKDKCR